MDGLNRGKKYGVVFTILLRSITKLLKIFFFSRVKLGYSSRNIFFVFVNYHTSRGGGQDQSIVNTRHFTRLSSHHLICMIKYDNFNILVKGRIEDTDLRYISSTCHIARGPGRCPSSRDRGSPRTLM